MIWNIIHHLSLHWLANDHQIDSGPFIIIIVFIIDGCELTDYSLQRNMLSWQFGLARCQFDIPIVWLPNRR